MTEVAAVLLKLLEYAAGAAPDALPAVRAIVHAFCACEGIDLGPAPPDGHEFDDVDKQIDEELKKS